MKNLFNFFSRVNPDGRTTVERQSSDSHSPRRYSVVSRITPLLFLLFLASGQMWATDYILGPDGSWTQNAAHTLGSSGITNWVYKDLAVTHGDSWTSFKVLNGSTWYGKDSGGNNVTVGSEYTPTTSGDNMYCDFKANGLTYYFFFNTSTKKFMIQPKYYLAGTCGASDQNWSTTANAPTYDATNGYFKWNTSSLTAGTEYKFKLVTYNSWNYYNYQDGGSVSVSQGTHETTDGDKNVIFTPTYSGTAVVTMVPTSNVMVVHCPYQISYNKGANGTGTNTTASKTWKTNLTLLGATFTRNGYTQDGWSTVDGGAKVYNLSGSYTTDADVTLYPHWTENMSSVSLVASPTGKGSFTIGGAAATSTTAGVTTTRSVTAVPISGYHFVSWSITGGATISSPTTNPTTVTGGGAGTAATLTATFAADDVYSLTVAAGTGISAVTGSTSNISAAQNIAITATVATGYTWSTWTKTGAGTLSTFTAGTKNQTVTVGTVGDITLTASATENMSSLSTSCHYDAGNPSYAAPTVSNSATNVGYVTTRTITATAAGTGYTFAGWTLTNCTRTDGGSATSTSITIRSNGDGKAATVVANYNEVLTSTYKLKGAFDSWGDGVAMSKKSGHSTENWVYCTKEFTTGEVTALKVSDGVSTWYGAQNASNSLVKTVGSLTVSGWTLTSTDGGHEIYFGHYISGTYEFGYNTSTKEFKVTWPDVNQLNISAASPTDATNTNAFDLSSPVSNVRSKTLTLNANTTYTFKIVYGSDWYGKNSGALTRSTSTSSNTLTGLSTSGGDMTLTTDYAGTYTFKFNESTKVLSIDFPEAYRPYFEVGTVKGNKNAIKLYRGSTANENEISSGTWVLKDTEVFFWVSNNTTQSTFCKPGYNWWGFYDNAEGTTPTQYRNSDVTVYHPTITSDMHVYAVFGENNYTVKIYNNGNGDVYEGGSIVNATTAHVATASNTLTATPQTGYKFDSWDQFSDSLTINSPSTAATTIKIKDTKLGDNARLRANFSPRWSVLGSGAFGGWEAYDAHKFDNYAVVSTKDVGYNTITLAANTNYEIKVYDRQTSIWYGGSANQDITYGTSGPGNEYTIATTASPKSVFIQSAAGGSYTLNWNLTDKKIAVVYPTSWFITSGQKTTGQADDAGGSFTAVDDASNNVKGGKFVANNANVTFTATPNTGYNFDGWYSDASCETAYVNGTGGAAISGEGGVVLTLSSITADKTVYAKFTPKTYTITLTRSGEGYSTGGDATATATYNTALPAVTLPTATNGWAFMGYYSGENGTGTQFMNASGTWATSVPDTIVDSKWKLDAGVTLYAYFKKAQITELSLAAAIVGTEETDSITVTPTISPTPIGPVIICWEVQYSNGSALDPQPKGRIVSGNTYRFKAPSTSGSYKVQATLRTGSACGGGTALHMNAANFTVAGEHTVSVQYKCGDVTVKAATVEEGIRPLEWSSAITPGDAPFGYTFDHWQAGDGVTISTNATDTIEGTTTTTATIYIKAIYDGRLTAVYTKDNIIYFKNTLGWTNVYFHNSYWDNSQGGAGNKGQTRNQAMLLVPGTTDIYYWKGTPGTNVAFTDHTYVDGGDGYQAFWSKTFDAKVVYPSNPTCASSGNDAYGYNAGTPMFVPIVQDAITFNEKDGGKALYSNKGYWRYYDPTSGEANTGYTLKIYDKTEDSGRNLVYSVPFTNSAVDGQLFTATVNLEAATGYGVKIERDNSMLYTNTEGHLHRTGDVVVTEKGDGNYKAIWLKSTAAGEYQFIITCNGNGKICLQATFPAASGDYRVLYTDNATWSNGAHTAQSWVHPSRMISAAANAEDTISFFVAKTNSPQYKIEKVNEINETTGAITWTQVQGWTNISVAATGVYNFKVTQNAAGNGISSVTNIGEYTGHYYIRTDNAGSTKWDNYCTEDHKMTYSEYSKQVKDYTHYYMKYVDRDKESGKYKNVKFTIANEYSPCISDTLVQQAGDLALTHVDDGGNLAENANIRFMWDVRNNKLQRAYLSPAQNDGSKFLVLQGQYDEENSKPLLADPSGNRLLDASGNNKGGGTDAIQFTDKENWVYEANVKAVPGGRVKLYAKFHGGDFYFYGAAGASFAGDNAIDLVSGTGEAQNIRVIYDFKTDRLMAAWVPSNENITTEQTVNADIMLVRDQQGSGQQINLSGSGSITTNKTVYGVMRFNRWTLNNKSTAEGHAPLPVGDQKSQYERFNYFISFPFDVKVGEIFGFGTVGRHWRISYYDGLGRAQEGFFAERGGSNWRMIDDTDSILHANQGYLLQLNSIRMADDNTSTWPQASMNEAELYFPAMGTVNKISLDNITIPALSESYRCTIDLSAAHGGNTEADRRIKDSYWRCIGVPGFTSYTATAAEWTNFNWKADAENLPYLYEWQMDDNKLKVVSSATFTFQPMHAYLIQNSDSFTWTSVAVPTTASSIVARRQAPASEDSFYEFYLEMRQDDQALDHTYIRLTNNERATTGFDFGQDLSKELNKGNNIYSHVGYERLAANNLPMSEQTTVVPVGVTAEADGDYTLSMSEGTHGVGVTLIDNETGVRTNLSLFDYNVHLTKGDYDQRFVLEISPVQQTATDIESTEYRTQSTDGARKVMIDQILYIVKDGKVYDARGAKIQ